MGILKELFGSKQEAGQVINPDHANLPILRATDIDPSGLIRHFQEPTRTEKFKLVAQSKINAVKEKIIPSERLVLEQDGQFVKLITMKGNTVLKTQNVDTDSVGGAAYVRARINGQDVSLEDFPEASFTLTNFEAFMYPDVARKILGG